MAEDILEKHLKKPIAFGLRMLLAGIDGMLQCYIKNYPAEKCKTCSFKVMCRGLNELKETTKNV